MWALIHRVLPSLLSTAALFFGCAAGPPARPPIDESAMREAIDSARRHDGDYASSAAYAHYLRSRIAHFADEQKMRPAG